MPSPPTPAAPFTFLLCPKFQALRPYEVLHFQTAQETKVKSIKLRCHGQENTHSPYSLGDHTELWAHRKEGFLLNASEIKISSLASFDLPLKAYILSCREGQMGRRERDEGKRLVKKTAIPKCMVIPPWDRGLARLRPQGT